MQYVRNRAAVRWGLPLAWMGLIFYLSAQSTLPNLTPGAPGLEEVGGHFLAYAVLALLLWLAFHAEGVRYPALWALLITALYGISDEFHQSFVPRRTPSVEDWLVDVAGAVVGVGIAAAMGRRSVKRA